MSATSAVFSKGLFAAATTALTRETKQAVCAINQSYLSLDVYGCYQTIMFSVSGSTIERGILDINAGIQ